MHFYIIYQLSDIQAVFQFLCLLGHPVLEHYRCMGGGGDEEGFIRQNTELKVLKK